MTCNIGNTRNVIAGKGMQNWQKKEVLEGKELLCD